MPLAQALGKTVTAVGADTGKITNNVGSGVNNAVKGVGSIATGAVKGLGFTVAQLGKALYTILCNIDSSHNLLGSVARLL